MTLSEPLFIVVAGTTVAGLGLVVGSGVAVAGGGIVAALGGALVVIAVRRIGRTHDAWQRPRPVVDGGDQRY